MLSTGRCALPTRKRLMALAGDPLELRFKMRLARHRRGTPSSIVGNGCVPTMRGTSELLIAEGAPRLEVRGKLAGAVAQDFDHPIISRSFPQVSLTL